MKTLTRLFVALGLFAMATLALAAGKPFNQAEFDTLQKAGQPIFLKVHADWCSTCKAQDPIVQSQVDHPDNQNITFFVIDFDKEKRLLRSMRITRQSSLVTFKDGKEVGRTVGDTTPAGIAALVATVR
jgi:thiol-disulfide isomerase/thioredoxin